MSFRPFSQSITEQKRYSFPNLFSFLHVSMIGIYNGQYEFITTESTQNVTSFVLHLKSSTHHGKQGASLFVLTLPDIGRNNRMFGMG